MTEPQVWTIIAVMAAAFAAFIGLTVNLLTRVLQTQFARLGDRIDRIDLRMDRLDGRMDRLEGRVGGLEGRVADLDRDVQGISRFLFRENREYPDGPGDRP